MYIFVFQGYFGLYDRSTQELLSHEVYFELSWNLNVDISETRNFQTRFNISQFYGIKKHRTTSRRFGYHWHSYPNITRRKLIIYRRVDNRVSFHTPTHNNDYYYTIFVRHIKKLNNNMKYRCKSRKSTF